MPYPAINSAMVPVDTTFLPPDSLSRSDGDFLLDVVAVVVGGVAASAPVPGLRAPETADIERAAVLCLLIRLWNRMGLCGVHTLFTLFALLILRLPDDWRLIWFERESASECQGSHPRDITPSPIPYISVVAL